MTEFKITPFPRPAAKPQKVIAVTDGACSGNPGPGGWGVVLRIGETVKELHGGAPAATNQRMEITAAIMALKSLEHPSEVEIVSDSQYVIYTMTKGWKRKANQDLWQRLDTEGARHSFVTWTWVRGHDGHADNERADELARLGIVDECG